MDLAVWKVVHQDHPRGVQTTRARPAVLRDLHRTPKVGCPQYIDVFCIIIQSLLEPFGTFGQRRDPWRLVVLVLLALTRIQTEPDRGHDQSTGGPVG